MPKHNDTMEYEGYLFRIVLTPEEIEALLLAGELRRNAASEQYTILENRLYRCVPDGTAEVSSYTGTKHARQYYVDEVEYGEKMHDRLCTFVFEQGEFLPEKSDVVLSDERFIAPLTWSERAEVRDGRTMLFLNPTGSVMQYEELLARYIFYANTQKLDKDWVDRMKQLRHPVFRMEVMQADDTGRFARKVYDLAFLAVRFLDAERLEWLIDTLPTDDPGYTEEISAEFRAALDGREAGDADAVREILRKFFETSDGGFVL